MLNHDKANLTINVPTSLSFLGIHQDAARSCCYTLIIYFRRSYVHPRHHYFWRCISPTSTCPTTLGNDTIIRSTTTWGLSRHTKSSSVTIIVPQSIPLPCP